MIKKYRTPRENIPNYINPAHHPKYFELQHQLKKIKKAEKDAKNNYQYWSGDSKTQEKLFQEWKKANNETNILQEKVNTYFTPEEKNIFNESISYTQVWAADFETKNNPHNLVQSFAIARSLVFKTNTIAIKDSSSYFPLKSDVHYFDKQGEEVIIDFFDYLENNLYGKNIIYFHNFRGFDGWFAIPEIIKRYTYRSDISSSYYFQDLESDIRGKWKWINGKGKILEIQLQLKNAIIIFRDSLNYWTMPLKAMGDWLSLPKGDSSITTFDLALKKDQPEKYEEFVHYSKRDVEILRDFLYKILDDTKINFMPKVTNAGASFAYFKSLILNDDSLSKNEKQKTLNYLELTDNNPEFKLKRLWDDINHSYNGGYTYSNPKHRGKINKINYYDKNSSYPSAMTQELPIEYVPNPDPKKKYLKLYRIEITKATLKKGYMPIIRNRSAQNEYYEKIIKPIEYTVWEQELEYFKRFYDIEFETIKTFHFKGKAFLKPYILNVYNQRLEWKEKAKDGKNEVAKSMANTLKIILNSFYGKFGQHYNQDQYVLLPYDLKRNDEFLYPTRVSTFDNASGKWSRSFQQQKHIVKSTTKYEYNHDMIHYKRDYVELENGEIIYGEYKKYIQNTNLKLYIIGIVDDETDTKKIWNKMYNIAIASYTTMKGRIVLFEQIALLANEFTDDFIYCDTDSIITKGDFHGELDDEKLGAWKCEYENARILPYGAKRYFLDASGKMIIKVAGYQRFAQGREPKTLEEIANKPQILAKLSRKRDNRGVDLWDIESILENGEIKKI